MRPRPSARRDRTIGLRAPIAVRRFDFRSRLVLAFVATFVLLTLASAPSRSALAAQEIPQPTPAVWRREAHLREVQFLDARLGWACGDRGTILRTEDGGTTWVVVPSSVDCRLDSLWFADARNGWAVGGYELPGSARRVGVVVATNDGGTTWRRMSTLGLPWLHRVRFADAQVGYAIGEISTRERSGIFITRDGGRNWSALTGFAPQAWLDGDSLDRATFALVGGRGGAYRFEGDRFEAAPALDGLVPRLSRVRFSTNGIGWAIGERGSIYRSHDQGRSWRSALDRALLPGIEQVEWSALAVAGTSIWVAGSPGNLLLHSNDDGENWSVIRTGIEGTISSLAFVDGGRGWAVGSLGRIHVTEDGGFTWRPQRNGQVRSFVTAVVSDPRRVPLELIAKLGAQDGWLVDVLIPQVGDGPTDARQSWRCGFEQWALQVGAADVRWWNAPHPGVLPPPRNDDQRRQAAAVLSVVAQQEAWKRQVVLDLRTNRPMVVILPNPFRSDPTDGERRLYDLALEAVAAAANPQAYPDQLHLLGLSTWQVAKTMSWSTRDGRTGIAISPDQYSLEIGRTLSDFCLPARAALAPDSIAVPPFHQLQLLATDLPTAIAADAIGTGIDPAPIASGRRRVDDAPRGTFQQVQQLAKVDEVHRRLVAAAADDAADPRGTAWISQVDVQIANLDPWSAGNWLVRLAAEHQRQQQSKAAARAYRLLLDRFPDHPLADASALWLFGHYASVERNWVESPGSRRTFLSSDDQGRNLAPVSFDEALDRLGFERDAYELLDDEQQEKLHQFATRMGVDPADIPTVTVTDREQGREAHLPIFIFGGDEAAVSRAGTTQVLPYADLDPQDIPGYLGALDAWVRSGRPELANDWRFRLVGTRRAATAAAAEWQALADYDPKLTPIAEAELWLLQPSVRTPPADRIDPPMVRSGIDLDGRLDEPVWQQAIDEGRHAALRADDGTRGGATTVVIARDDEFLYLAATCRKYDDLAYPPAPGPRLRDERPGEVDHLVFRIDADRDHRIAYVLKVDHRGRVWDGVDADGGWNPQWFVAQHETDRTWTIEAALPIEQLTAEMPREDVWWGLAIERRSPIAGASWGAHASSGAPQGTRDLIAGLLRLAAVRGETPVETPGEMPREAPSGTPNEAIRESIGGSPRLPSGEYPTVPAGFETELPDRSGERLR